MNGFINHLHVWATSKPKTKVELEEYKQAMESNKKDKDFVKIDYLEEFTKLN